MGGDKYKVEILHYLNPYLIWALVEKDGEENKTHFEQLGIYGISPLSVTIDIEGTVETNRCQKWLPAVYIAMKKLFLEASEVWFSVTFCDKTISIFDDNLHKYGDFILKMNNGETVSMLEELLNTGFVADDVGLFHQNLKTNLDYVNTVAVVNNIRQSLKVINKSNEHIDAILKMQTSIFLKTVEFEDDAVAGNFCVGIGEKHSQLMLHKRLNDLNACKDVDEKSAGRACRKTPARLNSGLRKKLNLIQAQKVSGAPAVTKNTDDSSSECNQHADDSPINFIESKTRKKNNRRGKPGKGNVVEKDKKYIAFGPPGINPTKFHLREIETDSKLPPTDKETQDKKDNDYSSILNKANSEDVLEQKDVPDECIKHNDQNKPDQDNTKNIKEKRPSSPVQRKMNILKKKIAKLNTSSSTADTDSTVKGDDSDSESISALVAKLDVSSGSIKKEVKSEPETVFTDVGNNVNPFKNLDGSKSVFVEKLVSPTLMVHTKKGNRILPVSNLRDIPFGSNIHVVLRNMLVKKPMRVQTVSWPTILRGHSLFLVSPNGSGKTLGYLPAVCRLVSDSKNTADGFSVSRLTCIIVCATSKSAYHVEEMCKMFLHEARIFACYSGMTDVTISTNILNGCDILISTPPLLVHLMRENLGLDLRSLSTLVIDDCELISEVYQNEIKFCFSKVKEMLKGRANKELKVQYVVASRIWSTFMSSLAKKAPDSVVCIGAFQECVLYSESDTSFQFLEKEKKMEAVLSFLDSIDNSKKTVIACRSDDEVHLIEKALTNLKYVVYACDSTMTIHDLYAIDLSLSEYSEPLKGPILVCCDGNLNHLNITDAHYLIHFSLPELFSMFSKRFAVLIDNYASLFNSQDNGVKIKIFLETNNVEQLPKILHFIKRCSGKVPADLDKISASVMLKKDLEKAKAFVPLCNTLLRLGKCVDIGYCKERHAIFEDFDKPLAWIPREGTITFEILHYHSPVHYSVRVMSCTTNSGVKKYPQTYSTLSIKLGMYYSKEKNKKLHGVAKPGDVCAVSLKRNFFARCQVLKVLKYTQDNLPSQMLINLIDEEKLEMACDTSLYHLPDDLKNIDSHVAKVILANIAPQERDISYSKLAEDQIKKITGNSEEIYMRAQISLVIGNCIFVETLEACQDLSSINETVVKNNIRDELLDGHAVNNPGHIDTLLKLGEHLEFVRKNVLIEKVEVPKPIKVLPKPRWAHLDSEEQTLVYYLYAESPSLFFVQNAKFQNCLKNLLSDIKKHVAENPEPIHDVKQGDIVLAKFPDDTCFERARVDSVIDSNNIKCFFVDLGDWSIVTADKVLPISENIITQLPFQAIECRLVGIRPVGDKWSEFSTNWFVDQFYESDTKRKYLFAKRFTKEEADFTEGSKYGIGLIDTYADNVYINKLMIDANLAEENEEIEYLNTIYLEKTKDSSDDSDLKNESDNEISKNTNDDKVTVLNTSQKPKTRSLPSHLLPYAKNNDFISNSTSALTLSNNNLVENNLTTPVKEITPTKASVSDYVDKSQINNIHNTDCSESDNNKHLTLVSPFKGEGNNNNEANYSESSSSSEDSLENSRANQQAVMNLLRSNPMRSMPLVNDDIDVDRWDSSNPIQMLMAPNQDTSNVSEAPKTILPSLNNVKPEADVRKKSEIIENVRVNDNIDNVKTLSGTDKDIKPIVSLGTSTKLSIWSVTDNNQILSLYDETSKAKIIINWCQDNTNVTIKVQMQLENYELFIDDKKIKFLAKVNHTDYGFEFELYGVINIEKSTHTKKDAYVEINLNKVLAKKWLTLYKGSVRKVVCANANVRRKSDAENTKNEENLRKPKIVWRQNKIKVTIKIMLITEKYELTIQDKHIKFYAQANDEEYGFEFELYGVIDVNKSSHSNKGQYIQASLSKVMGNNWLVLGKGYVKKWIVYDFDGIDVSSEDEQELTDDITNLRNHLNLNQESDSEDDFADDVNFEYKKQY
ncbi:unnamed protein product [Arctia plantaginis]|uniref:RNA helicase n=1 Tax=Arctia plantaginis TaxID=874455 RepID=A0A8S1BQ70_ARCPL|nr:unnamed protein product [Arctia plantaginis]